MYPVVSISVRSVNWFRAELAAGYACRIYFCPSHRVLPGVMKITQI